MKIRKSVFIVIKTVFKNSMDRDCVLIRIHFVCQLSLIYKDQCQFPEVKCNVDIKIKKLKNVQNVQVRGPYTL